jgi:hypothetical protein
VSNDAPLAESDSVSTRPDTSVTLDVSANDSDPDGDALSVTSVGAATAASHGTTTLNADGTVTYTPVAGYTGADSFSYTVSDGQGGEATASVDVTVTEEVLSFAEEEFSGYDNQDQGGSVSVSDGGTTVSLVGNTWKKAPVAYEVTDDTVLSFDFRAPSEGEIQGIGVEVDGTWDNGNDLAFVLAGSQTNVSDRASLTYDQHGTANDSWQSYTIELGQHYTGEISALTFLNDHDVANPTAEGEFRNISLSYEPNPANELGIVGQAQADIEILG